MDVRKGEQISFENSDEEDQTEMKIDQIVKKLEQLEQASMQEDVCSESNTSEDEDEESYSSEIKDDDESSEYEVEEDNEDNEDDESYKEDEDEEDSTEDEGEESYKEDVGEESYKEDQGEEGSKEDEGEEAFIEDEGEESSKEDKVEEGYKEDEGEKDSKEDEVEEIYKEAEGFKEDEGEKTKGDVTEGDEDTEEDELYIVEKILDKRERRGVVEYYIKWQNFSHDFNSWEPEDNMFCQGLIDQFERRHRVNQTRARKLLARRCKQVGRRTRWHQRKRKSNAMPSERNKMLIYEGSGNTYEVVETEIGFKDGLTPKKILEASKHKGRIVFLMQWQETDSCHFVYHWEAKEKFPKIVLDFYDKFVTWIE